MPLAKRLDVPPETLPLEGLVVHLEQRLKDKPKDSEGWLMLARTRMALGEADRAEDALLNVISLRQGDKNPDILVMLAESRLQQQDGLMDDGIERLVNRALEINPDHPRGLYLRGLSLLQQGNKSEAIAIWSVYSPPLTRTIRGRYFSGRKFPAINKILFLSLFSMRRFFTFNLRV